MLPSDFEVFGFLEELRESGVTNMWGATPYIQEEFGIERSEARKFLLKWIESHNDKD